MPTHEQQRILNQINSSKTERAGWTGFVLGVLFTCLLFILIFIPIAQQEARVEFITSGNCTIDR